MMEEIATLKLPIVINAIVVLIGIFIYNVGKIMASKRVKKFSDINIKIWWLENQIRFIMSLMVIAILFYTGCYYNTLTVERSLMLGIVGNLLLDKMLKALNV